MDVFLLHGWWLRGGEVRYEEWKSAIADRPTPDPATAEVMLATLEGQVGRHQEALTGLDNKAALVVPAVGVIAGLVGSNVSSKALSDPGLRWLLFAIGVAAGLSMLASLIVLLPTWGRSVGPEPVKLLSQANQSPDWTRNGLLNSLGYAAESADQAFQAKAKWLRLSLLSGAVAIILLMWFVWNGGLTG